MIRRDKGTPARTRRLHSLVVVRVDTHFVLLGVEGVLAQLHRPQLVVGLQVGPAPQAAVDDVRQTFPVGNLQAAIQRPAGGEEEAEMFVKNLSNEILNTCIMIYLS